MTEIRRPPVEYDDKKHSYTLHGEKLHGVSTIAKVGDDEVWGIASAWAFRIGYEGAWDLYEGDSLETAFATKDDLREALKRARKTPWHKTDAAKDRGNALHDALEQLAQHAKVPVLSDFPEAERGYVQALCKWYGDYRPSFVATEVQVCSETHGFAGRYDFRASIQSDILFAHNKISEAELRANPNAWLTLDDLKTGKRVYPKTQFPQLAGYECAGVEMGYPATDAQFILNIHEDGTYDFERSYAEPWHFLAYLEAHKARVDLAMLEKQAKKKEKA